MSQRYGSVYIDTQKQKGQRIGGMWRGKKPKIQTLVEMVSWPRMQFAAALFCLVYNLFWSYDMMNCVHLSCMD